MPHECRLVDAEAHNRSHPTTFLIPSLDERESIEPGDVVKVMFDTPDGIRERIWVSVIGRLSDGSYAGKLANQPVVLPWKHGDPVWFGPENVIAIDE